jgi:hypothetical protein
MLSMISLPAKSFVAPQSYTVNAQTESQSFLTVARLGLLYQVK